MYIADVAFFAKISDPLVGGKIKIFLDTLINLFNTLIYRNLHDFVEYD